MYHMLLHTVFSQALHYKLRFAYIPFVYMLNYAAFTDALRRAQRRISAS